MQTIKKKILLFCLLGVLVCVSGCSLLREEIQETPPYIQVAVDEETFTDKFYYEQLGDEEKQIYQEIYQGLLDLEEEICLHWIEAEDANRILHNVLYDFAEIFWTDGSATTTTYDETVFTEGHTMVEVNYVYSKEETEQRRKQIAESVETILQSVPEGYSQYQKIKYIYEYLVNHVDYVEGSPDNQNIYSVFVNKQTVCAGYAKANQYLLNELGVYCTYVTGTAVLGGESEAHAWNIVRCNGKFYYVDVTWADPLFREGQLKLEDVVYDYLCCSEDVLGETHTLDEGYEYPVCNSNDLEYYRLNGMYYIGVESRQLFRAMQKTIDARGTHTIFKFANKELYNEGKQLLLDELLNRAGEYLCQIYRLNQVQYQYIEYDHTNRFVVYWQYHS